jgi:hypothetical protein
LMNAVNNKTKKDRGIFDLSNTESNFIPSGYIRKCQMTDVRANITFKKIALLTNLAMG